MTRSDGSAGFALVLVLWVSLLLAVIAASLVVETRSEVRLAETETSQLQARLAADGAIERVILSLIDLSDGARWRIDGSARSISVGDQSVTVSVTSEAGKIDLNASPQTVLVSLFESEGLSVGDSAALADRIVAWRSAVPNGGVDFGAGQYRDSGRRYGPRYGQFRTVGELRLVLGMTDELQAKLAPILTVQTHTANVDLGVASEPVLSALAGTGNRFAATQLEARRAGNAAGVDRQPGAGEPLCIEAETRNASSAISRVACVRLLPNGDSRYEVLSWR